MVRTIKYIGSVEGFVKGNGGKCKDRFVGDLIDNYLISFPGDDRAILMETYVYSWKPYYTAIFGNTNEIMDIWHEMLDEHFDS